MNRYGQVSSNILCTTLRDACKEQEMLHTHDQTKMLLGTAVLGRARS